MVLEQVYFGNTLQQYLIFAAILGASIILGRALYWFFKNIVRKFTAKTKSELDDLIVDVLEEPGVFFLFIAAFYFGTKVLTLSERVLTIFRNVSEIMVIICAAWLIIRIIDALLVRYIAPLTKKTETDLDDLLLPVLRRVIKITIIAIALIMIINNFGYDVTSLVAGLGIGGLAFALAAKDLLSNMFGGVFIMTDKPFKLGDRIRIDGYDGFVKEIGLRSIRITTLSGTEVIVPNSKMADSFVENVSREKTRKVILKIGLTYETSSRKMEQAKKILEEVLKSEKTVSDDYAISFTEFGDSALILTIIYRITDLKNIFGVMDSVNSNIKRQFDLARINMAYPTQTIHVKR